MNLNWNREDEPSAYDKAIKDALKSMETFSPEDDEYPKHLAALEALTKLKRNKRPKFGVSPDTFAIVAGNLLGILIIVAYEQKHAMTSKGLNYVKPKQP